LGVAVLAGANPAHVRAGVGGLLVLYSLYGLARPALRPGPANETADAGGGLLNGIFRGLARPARGLVAISGRLRRWSKDEQRTVFQAVGVAIFAMTGLWLGVGGSFEAGTVRLFLLGLPVLLLGTWLGLKLYGRLDDAGFRKVVLVLLLVSGAALLLPG